MVACVHLALLADVSRLQLYRHLLSHNRASGVAESAEEYSGKQYASRVEEREPRGYDSGNDHAKHVAEKEWYFVARTILSIVILLERKQDVRYAVGKRGLIPAKAAAGPASVRLLLRLQDNGFLKI